MAEDNLNSAFRMLRMSKLRLLELGEAGGELVDRQLTIFVHIQHGESLAEAKGSVTILCS